MSRPIGFVSFVSHVLTLLPEFAAAAKLDKLIRDENVIPETMINNSTER